MAKAETLRKKADALLKAGDAEGGALGRRLLRKCMHYRRLTRLAEAKER